MHIYPLQSTFWTFKKSISIVKIQKNKNKSSFNENYAYILKLGLMNSFEHFTFLLLSHYEAWFQISKRNKYSVGFVFATINLFLCCHENLLVPTHTQSQREIEIQLVCFVENLAQTSVFSNPLILKNKKHKGTIYDK